MVYKFNTLSKEEIAAMLNTSVEDVRALREVRDEEREKIALKMLRKNMALDLIAEFTDLSIAQVQDLQNQLNRR